MCQPCARESLTAKPKKIAPTPEVAPADRALRRRKAAASRTPPKISFGYTVRAFVGVLNRWLSVGRLLAAHFGPPLARQGDKPFGIRHRADRQFPFRGSDCRTAERLLARSRTRSARLGRETEAMLAGAQLQIHPIRHANRPVAASAHGDRQKVSRRAPSEYSRLHSPTAKDHRPAPGDVRERHRSRAHLGGEPC